MPLPTCGLLLEAIDNNAMIILDSEVMICACWFRLIWLFFWLFFSILHFTSVFFFLLSHSFPHSHFALYISLFIHFSLFIPLLPFVLPSRRNLVSVIQQLYQRVIRLLRTTLWPCVWTNNHVPALPPCLLWLLYSMPSSSALPAKRCHSIFGLWSFHQLSIIWIELHQPPAVFTTAILWLFFFFTDSCRSTLLVFAVQDVSEVEWTSAVLILMLF